MHAPSCKSHCKCGVKVALVEVLRTRDFQRKVLGSRDFWGKVPRSRDFERKVIRSRDS